METKTWMDIWKEWMKQSTKLNIMDFYDWLEANYEVPNKKELLKNAKIESFNN